MVNSQFKPRKSYKYVTITIICTYQGYSNNNTYSNKICNFNPWLCTHSLQYNSY